MLIGREVVNRKEVILGKVFWTKVTRTTVIWAIVIPAKLGVSLKGRVYLKTDLKTRLLLIDCSQLKCSLEQGSAHFEIRLQRTGYLWPKSTVKRSNESTLTEMYKATYLYYTPYVIIKYEHLIVPPPLKEGCT